VWATARGPAFFLKPDAPLLRPLVFCVSLLHQQGSYCDRLPPSCDRNDSLSSCQHSYRHRQHLFWSRQRSYRHGQQSFLNRQRSFWHRQPSLWDRQESFRDRQQSSWARSEAKRRRPRSLCAGSTRLTSAAAAICLASRPLGPRPAREDRDRVVVDAFPASTARCVRQRRECSVSALPPQQV
jgi:hypothetical protein